MERVTQNHSDSHQTPSTSDCSPVFSVRISTTSVPSIESWKFSKRFSHVRSLLVLGDSVVPTILVLPFPGFLQWIFFHGKSCCPGSPKTLQLRSQAHHSCRCQWACMATPLSAPPPILELPPTLSTDTIDVFPLLPCLWPKGPKTKPEHTPGSS